MSFINDLFKPKEQSPAKEAPAAPAKEASKAENPNPNNPSKDSENPLDAYTKMFENASKNSDIHAPSFSLDPTVLQEVSSKMDFIKDVNPELLQKATSGDVNALVQIIQETSRSAYRASLEHSTKLTDTHLTQRAGYEAKKLQKGVKEQLTSDALASNANYNHPVVKAELNRIARDFANTAEYADASPQEIAKAAKDYLDQVHSAINPVDPSKDSKGNDTPKEIDYMKYING